MSFSVIQETLGAVSTPKIIIWQFKDKALGEWMEKFVNTQRYLKPSHLYSSQRSSRSQDLAKFV
jgi:hypothetical protein